MSSSFEEIFQGWLEKEEYNKNKGFLKKGRYWKKYFCVLRHYDGDSNVYLQWFEKEDEWRKEFPIGSIGLFPKYSVYKHKTEKGKPYFEVSNDEEAHYFLANNEVTMDLWVVQLMMQTRLSPSMIETSFRVKGGDSKCLQRIGAKNLNCLLHISEWGITLALERTHSVLSQWPLTTIRNYECSDNNEFVFEGGRKSPMGEGKYEFLTYNGEDNALFDQIDHYTSLRARRVRSVGGRNRLNSANDEEIAQAYGHLRWSVMLTSSTLNLGVIHAMPSQPQAIVHNNSALYNHLDRQPSMQSVQTNAIGDSYDKLDRTGSFSDQLSMERSYSRLNCNKAMPSRSESRRSMQEHNISSSYDHLERSPNFNLGRSPSLSERSRSFHGSPSRVEGRSRSFGSLEERNRFQIASPPTEEDSYNHLSQYRHASLPNSNSPRKNFEFYDKLDRSMASVHQASQMNSYDRLDSMQGSVIGDRDVGMSPPIPSNDSGAYDVFGNLRAHNSTPYQFTKSGQGLQDQEPLIVDLPPPLPAKPTFMSKGEKKANGTLSPDAEGRPELPPRYSKEDFSYVPRNDQNNGVPISQSSVRRDHPLPPRPSLNNEGSPGMPAKYGEETFGNNHESGTQNGAVVRQGVDTQYQSIDDGVEPQFYGSHYQVVEESRVEPEYAEARGRLNTHSSNPDLTNIPEEENKLDPSKRSTLHRSAPTLAHYTVIDKKSKGSPKLPKSGSTFKLDSFFKRIGRSSKKSEQELSPRKSKKSSKKFERVASTVSTSSIRPLVQDDDAISYVDIDGEESALARSIMERRDSKRPLPELPADSGINV